MLTIGVVLLVLVLVVVLVLILVSALVFRRLLLVQCTLVFLGLGNA